MAKKYPLPPLAQTQLPSLKNAVNRFSTEQQAPLGVTAASSRAYFAFVTGDVVKMKAVRDDALNYYGQGSEEEWMPYAPNEPDPIWYIAQSIATEKKLNYKCISVGSGLIQLLKQAEKDNSVAIMIVDPWIVRHPDYTTLLQQFDEIRLRNCVVLIAWNKFDPRTQAERDILLGQLRSVLSRNFEGQTERYFQPEKIEDRAALRSAISSALTDLEAVVARSREPARRTGESDYKRPPQLQA